jgi:Male sterility protein
MTSLKLDVIGEWSWTSRASCQGRLTASSLQAIWIRNSCMQALRKTPNVGLADVSTGFVYEHPTIESLSKYLLSVVYGEPAFMPRGADELSALVDHFTSTFRKHVPTSPAVDGEVFLVTGTTGALGSAVLAVLVATESVRKIFAFNRPSSSKGIVERQKEALKSRGYDPEIAVSSKVTLVEGKLDGSGLGVDQALEDEVYILFSILL